MPRLGEFIGAMLADAAQARVRADIEAIKLAEMYSSHELLRHLPVPRFRLPDISIEFPVVVQGVRDEAADPHGVRAFDEPPRDEVEKALVAALAGAKLKLSAENLGRLHDLAWGRLKAAFRAGPRALLGGEALAADVAGAVGARALSLAKGPAAAHPKLDEVVRRVRESVRALLLARLARSPHLEVLVSSGEIKAHADSSSVLRVRLTVSEDAYEVIPRDGEARGFTLVPE